jgi:hypothetical protein
MRCRCVAIDCTFVYVGALLLPDCCSRYLAGCRFVAVALLLRSPLLPVVVVDCSAVVASCCYLDALRCC